MPVQDASMRKVCLECTLDVRCVGGLFWKVIETHGVALVPHETEDATELRRELAFESCRNNEVQSLAMRITYACEEGEVAQELTCRLHHGTEHERGDGLWHTLHVTQDANDKLSIGCAALAPPQADPVPAHEW